MTDYARHASNDARSDSRGSGSGMLGGIPAGILGGLLILTGLFTAVAPRIVRAFETSPRVSGGNLVLGLALAVIGLVYAMTAARGHALGWVLVPLGIWLLVSPWIFREHPRGVVWTDVVLGIITTLLGLAAAGLGFAMASGGQSHSSGSQVQQQPQMQPSKRDERPVTTGTYPAQPSYQGQSNNYGRSTEDGTAAVTGGRTMPTSEIRYAHEPQLRYNAEEQRAANEAGDLNARPAGHRQ